MKTDVEKRETAKIESEKEEAHEKENTASKENRKEQRVESSSRLSEMEEESEEKELWRAVKRFRRMWKKSRKVLLKKLGDLRR